VVHQHISFRRLYGDLRGQVLAKLLLQLFYPFQRLDQQAGRCAKIYTINCADQVFGINRL
jgi:hypothetical protein